MMKETSMGHFQEEDDKRSGPTSHHSPFLSCLSDLLRKKSYEESTQW